MTIKPDWMRGLLAIVLLLSFQACLAALFNFEVPETNRDMVIYMLGQLSGMVTTALAFYFATSKSSADKTAVINSMTDQLSQPGPPVATGKPNDPIHQVQDDAL
jgi:hypothetical protein